MKRHLPWISLVALLAYGAFAHAEWAVIVCAGLAWTLAVMAALVLAGDLWDPHGLPPMADEPSASPPMPWWLIGTRRAVVVSLFVWSGFVLTAVAYALGALAGDEIDRLRARRLMR